MHSDATATLLMPGDAALVAALNRRRQHRAIATRYDKLAVRYQATVAVADIFIWLRARPDRPREDPSNTP